ncbi:MAG: NlpC/P60 family protein [Sarcina sp.]
MKKNKIAGLLVASALLVGAGAAHTHADANSMNNKITTNTNKILLAEPTHVMTKNAMVVNGNGNLVLRTNANSDSNIVSNISVGEMLQIQSYTTNWYKVTVKETGATGYISASNLRYIESGVNAPLTDLNANGHVINVTSSLNLRSEATMSSNVITTLKNGTSFRILGKQGEWFKIDVNGTNGFVYGGYVATGSQTLTPINQNTNTTNATNAINATVNTTTQNSNQTNKIEKSSISTSKQNSIKKNVSVANENSKKSTQATNNVTTEKTTVTTHANSTAVANASNTSKETKITTNQNINQANKVEKSSISTNKTSTPVAKTQSSETTSSTSASNGNSTTNVEKTSTVTPKTANVTKNNNNTNTNTNTTVNNNNNNNNNNNTVDNSNNGQTTTPVSKSAVEPIHNQKVELPTGTTPEVATTGSLTLSIYQTNTDQPLANTAVNINGTNYTTNSQGRVKLTGLSTGGYTFSISSNGFNPTSVISNVKAGKNMNKLIYITAKAQEVANNANNSNANNSNANNSNANNNNANNNNANNNNANNNNANNNNANNNNANNNNANNNSNVNQESTSQLQQAIVNYAESFLGTPYVWGATGPNAFDCSGLTYYVYKHFGYYIGCTTYTQIDKGTPVSVNNLQPGDLIFWGDPAAPYHVAIYIGNGQYIQAPRPGESVDISSWNLNNISAARRII